MVNRIMASAVINPVCGHRDGLEFYTKHVADKLPKNITTTTGRDLAFLLKERPETIIVVSGDGTVHELVNHLASSDNPHLNVAFVLIPSGTANALYASLFPDSQQDRLQSLQAYLEHRKPRHLTLATTTISESQSSIASVVVSTSLHASILHDSEALREQHPGIERYFVIDSQNIIVTLLLF